MTLILMPIRFLAAVLLHVVGLIHRVKDDRHVEKTEEDDSGEVEQVIDRLTVIQKSQAVLHPGDVLGPAHGADRLRDRQHR